MSDQCVQTPIEFLKSVRARFGQITFDLAADPVSNVVRRISDPDNGDENSTFYSTGWDLDFFRKFYFGPGSAVSENAFLKPWDEATTSGGLLWLNPPYADIGPWAQQAALACNIYRQRIAMLVPAAVCTNWCIEHVIPHAYIFELTPRPFPAKVRDCILALYEPAGYKGRETWKWR